MIHFITIYFRRRGSFQSSRSVPALTLEGRASGRSTKSESSKLRQKREKEQNSFRGRDSNRAHGLQSPPRLPGVAQTAILEKFESRSRRWRDRDHRRDKSKCQCDTRGVSATSCCRPCRTRDHSNPERQFRVVESVSVRRSSSVVRRNLSTLRHLCRIVDSCHIRRRPRQCGRGGAAQISCTYRSCERWERDSKMWSSNKNLLTVGYLIRTRF